MEAPMLAGRYQIGELLGRGGSACVFEGYDVRLARPVAIKRLRPEVAMDRAMRRRFEQEARTAARLTHPHAVAVYDTGVDDGQTFLVMERLPGRSLADRIVEGPLDPSTVAAIGLDVLSALQAAHALGMVHRDVKPGNILLTDEGRAKVADFGIAKSVDPPPDGDTTMPDATALGLVLGTPAYLAPERLTGQPATARGDLYALGVVLYESLTGAKPPPGPREVPGAPAPLAAVVLRALSPNPAERFSSAAEMASSLRAAAGAWDDAAPDGITAVVLADPADPTATIRSWRAAAGWWWRRAAQSRPAVVGSLLGIAAIAVIAVVMSGAATAPGGAALGSQSRAAAARTLAQSARSTTSTSTDPTASALDAAAAHLAESGRSGPIGLARELQGVAATPAGAARVARAQRVLGDADRLRRRGAVTAAQYAAAVAALEAAGAVVPGHEGAGTTTTTAPTATVQTVQTVDATTVPGATATAAGSPATASGSPAAPTADGRPAATGANGAGPALAAGRAAAGSGPPVRPRQHGQAAGTGGRADHGGGNGPGGGAAADGGPGPATHGGPGDAGPGGPGPAGDGQSGS